MSYLMCHLFCAEFIVVDLMLTCACVVCLCGSPCAPSFVESVMVGSYSMCSIFFPWCVDLHCCASGWSLGWYWFCTTRRTTTMVHKNRKRTKNVRTIREEKITHRRHRENLTRIEDNAKKRSRRTKQGRAAQRMATRKQTLKYSMKTNTRAERRDVYSHELFRSSCISNAWKYKQ